MVRDLRQDLSLLTSPFRVLPDFVIPGEAKCGTTSLYRYLTHHPDIFAADRKEPRNFIEHPGSVLFCRRHYPSIATKLLHILVHRRPFVTGEATAEYLSKANIPAMLQALIPDVKIVIMMRNPVTRAFSDYQMLRAHGLVNLDFGEVVARALRWLQDDTLRDLVEAAREMEHFYLRFVARGLYACNVRRWLDVFPREQLLFIKSERFFAEPQQTLDEVFGFLGLKACMIQEREIKRKGVYSEPMDKLSLEALSGFFEPYNQVLYELIRQDLAWETEVHALPAQ